MYKFFNSTSCCCWRYTYVAVPNPGTPLQKSPVNSILSRMVKLPGRMKRLLLATAIPCPSQIGRVQLAPENQPESTPIYIGFPATPFHCQLTPSAELGHVTPPFNIKLSPA